LKRLGFASALLILLLGCSFDARQSGAPFTPQIRLADLKGDFANPPDVFSSNGYAYLSIGAAINSTTNLPNFIYRGQFGNPTIRVWPGDRIEFALDDQMPPAGLGSDINVHFHGIETSPMKPADDVLTMLARPGQGLYYDVPVPLTQQPGLYWYHPHVHGETNYQVGEGGMSGAIVVEGITTHYPQLAKMPERILIVRQLGSAGGEAIRAPRNDGVPRVDMAAMESMDASSDAMESMSPAQSLRPMPAPVKNVPCAPEPDGAFLTINDEYHSTILVKSGQPQFFRVLNATGHRHLDLSLGGIPMHVVAIDGYPLDTNRGESIMTVTHYVVPVAGRVEFYATITKPTEFRSLCYFSGPIGDADPAELLARLRPTGSPPATRLTFESGVPRAPGQALGPLPAATTTRYVYFTENDRGFYINGQRFSIKAPPMFVVHTGTVERWVIENDTSENHDFHLHQVHFLERSIDGVAVPHPVWRDTEVVPYQTRLADGSYKPGRIVVLADFRNPLIKGTFLFHCHILDHEDMGMMAKILAL
jgi:FtsP/CotA-like multicopper oxidase with cupredoxin domain